MFFWSIRGALVAWEVLQRDGTYQSFLGTYTKSGDKIMKRKKKVEKYRKSSHFPPYQTLALADKERIDPDTNAGIPSEDAVISAKKWVDHNIK